MFRIHNRRLFWRLAGRSIKANLGRHLLTALAVFLSTVMLFSIFTIGVNYFRNLQTMMDRLDGVTDAILYAPTQEQYEQVKATPGVEAAGIRMSLGSETIPGTLGFEIPLQHWYYDEEAWEHQILPMLSDVVGTYPQDTLEVMMSIDTLKRLGIDEPEVGMTIHLTRDHQLTGWFTDYTPEDRVLRSESGAREFYSDFWGWESCQLGVCWSRKRPGRPCSRFHSQTRSVGFPRPSALSSLRSRSLVCWDLQHCLFWWAAACLSATFCPSPSSMTSGFTVC